MYILLNKLVTVCIVILHFDQQTTDPSTGDQLTGRWYYLNKKKQCSPHGITGGSGDGSGTGGSGDGSGTGGSL